MEKVLDPEWAVGSVMLKFVERPAGSPRGLGSWEVGKR